MGYYDVDEVRDEDPSCDRCGSNYLLERNCGEILCYGCILDESEDRTDGAEDDDTP